MSLYIYLERISGGTCAEFEAHERARSKYEEERYEALSTEHSGDSGYNPYSQDLPEDVRVWDTLHPGPVSEDIEFKSAAAADHWCKVGNICTGYGAGSLFAILRDTNLDSLDAIFGHERGDYRFQPDWQAVRSRALFARERLHKFVDANGPVRLEQIKANEFRRPDELVQDPIDAIEVYAQDRKLRRENGQSSEFDYSTLEGHFYNPAKPLQVVGAIVGRRESVVSKLTGRVLMQPCTYLIVRDEEGLKRTAEALLIIAETAEYVLKQPNPSEFCIRWSG